MEHMTYVTVEKEQIPTLKFGNTDVLTNLQERKKRMHDVSRATVLGNGYHGKVEIFFETVDGEPKRVVTTIWDCDQEHIILKSGACIPLRAVHGIEFY
jgi:hypothetical protein